VKRKPLALGSQLLADGWLHRPRFTHRRKKGGARDDLHRATYADFGTAEASLLAGEGARAASGKVKTADMSPRYAALGLAVCVGQTIESKRS
jgi:hypothetical protein